MTLKRFLTVFLAGCIFAGCLTGCGNNKTAADISVEDAEYYQKFKDDGISINVYNWGEYIPDGADGSVNINEEFTKLTGIKVNYSTYATNEELYA